VLTPVGGTTQRCRVTTPEKQHQPQAIKYVQAKSLPYASHGTREPLPSGPADLELDGQRITRDPKPPRELATALAAFNAVFSQSNGYGTLGPDPPRSPVPWIRPKVP
jgi:hypothetical protein